MDFLRLGCQPKLSAVIAGLVPAIPIEDTPSERQHDQAACAMRQYYVYILASRPGGAIYVGVTSNLIRRVYEHKNGLVQGHTKRYGINKLVYFEVYDTAYNAIQREKKSSIGRVCGKRGSSREKIPRGAIFMRRFVA